MKITWIKKTASQRISTCGNYLVGCTARTARTRKRWVAYYRIAPENWGPIASSHNGYDQVDFLAACKIKCARHAAAAEKHGMTPAESARKFV